MLRLLSKSSTAIVPPINSCIYFYSTFWGPTESCTWEQKFHTFRRCRVCGTLCTLTETKHIIRCKFMQCMSFFLWMCERIQPSHLFTHFLGNSPHLLGECADVIHTLASAPAHVTCDTVFLTFASSLALPLIPLSSCCRSRRYGNCNYFVSPHFFLSLSLCTYIYIHISMSVHPVLLIHA